MVNGAQDMGGAHGFGPVEQEVDEPLFHAEWEPRVLAMNLAGSRWNIDASRFAREDTPPADYLARSYYEMWLYGFEKLAIEHGMFTEAELEAAKRGEHFSEVTDRRMKPDQVERLMRRGGSARVDVDVDPLFAVGDIVKAKVAAPQTHTRCPGYVRGRTGTIAIDHGVFVFPDTNAHGEGEKPQHVYAVRFEAEELWGPDAQGGAVYVDLWDDHLETA